LPVHQELLQARIIAFTLDQNLLGSVSVVLVGRRDKDLQNAFVGIGEEVSLVSFDLCFER
jgi:hypothetical protein